MNRIRFLSRPIVLAAVVAAAQAHAQTTPEPAPVEVVAPATPNADRLAEQMRILATDPRNLDALLTAGELSAKLDDPAAAFAFFYRAEEVDPTNPRIQAGRARVLVRTERPGEALALFAEAERKGMPASSFAADRGLAYDLLGAPMLAQIDYRTALANDPDDDETIRRYALSLGIRGQVDQAMQLLDPLLRRNDRAAWRARAFILAMNGDVDTAEQIASNMLPGNMGQGLRPFFRRLENMTPSERAFAVHFGELKASPQRLADARLAPPLPSAAPPAVVSAGPPQPPVHRDDRRGRRARDRDEEKKPPTSVAAAVVVRPVPVAVPLPPPPRPPVEPAPQPVVTAPPVRLATSAPVAAPAAPRPVPVPREAPAKPVPVANPEAGKAEPAKPAPVVKPEPRKVESAKPEVKKPEAAKPAPKKPEPKKPDPKKPDPKKAEPARIWVQVAGGADEAALPGTWRKLVKAAPAAFKGRSPWSTPLRATNRLLTGPFKTADEAQAFVNSLAKEGLSAFVFTSEAGQKITKLTVK